MTWQDHSFQLSDKKRSIKKFLKNRNILKQQYNAYVTVRATVSPFSLSFSSFLLLSSSPFSFSILWRVSMHFWSESHHSATPMFLFQTSVQHTRNKDNTITFMNLKSLCLAYMHCANDLVHMN